MRKIAGIVIVSAFCFLAACRVTSPTTTNAEAVAGFDGWSWYLSDESKADAADVGVSATWGTWDQKFVYVIIADISATSTTSLNKSGARTEYKVDLALPNGPKAEVRIETADGKTGSALHAGQSFDLSNGSVFAFLLRGGELELRQLNRGITEFKAGVPGVQKLVRLDPDLVRMFATAKK